MASTFDATSTAGTPRSERDQLFVVTPVAQVASPYYADQRLVTPNTYTYVPVLA
jgi:hypothetical protein